jgi:hypothetical protein
LLFIITFILNAIAEFYVRAKLMKRFRGEWWIIKFLVNQLSLLRYLQHQ